MNDSAIDKSVRLLLVAILLSSSTIVFGGTDPLATDGKDYSKEIPPAPQSWCQTPPDWEISIGAPGWFSSLSGDIGVKGIVSDIDISFDQIFRHLTHVPIALSADIRYKRWEFFGDGQYLEVSDSATLPGLLFTNANAHVKVGLAEAFVGYRLINCDKATLSLFAGARYTYLEAGLSIFNNGDARLVRLRELLGIRNKLDFSGSTDWFDPVIGARGKVKIWKAISLYAQGDVGGFDANSGSAFQIHREGRTIVRRPVDSTDWSYQVAGGLEFQLSRQIFTQVGWRYMKYDFRKSGFTDRLELNGPFLQTGMNF